MAKYIKNPIQKLIYKIIIKIYQKLSRFFTPSALTKSHASIGGNLHSPLNAANDLMIKKRGLKDKGKFT